MQWPGARIVTAVLILALLSPHIAVAGTFSDIRDSWYRSSIEELAERGVISGYDDGTFRPRQAVNRAEFLKMVLRGRGGGEPTRRRCFADVPVDAWYTAYVCAAKRRGIIQGYKGNVFRADHTVNLAEALKMVLEAYNRQPPPAQSGEYWYAPYLAYAGDHGIIGSVVDPAAPVTRELMADIIVRVLRVEERRETANRSAGCSTTPPPAPLSSVEVDGLKRHFLLTLPGNYSPRTPYRLVVAFHGRTNSNEQVRDYYGIDRADDTIVAYPAAVQREDGTYSWADPASDDRDVRFFDELVYMLGQQYCIDPDRVYVVGHSLGAWFANSIACVRGDVLRGAATVAGASTGAPCRGRIASLLMHNPEDNLTSFSSGEKARDQRLAQNGCGPKSVSVEPSAFRCVMYDGCAAGASVIWCPHRISTDHRGTWYPHVWPDGAGQAILAFFQQVEGLREMAIEN